MIVNKILGGITDISPFFISNLMASTASVTITRVAVNKTNGDIYIIGTQTLGAPYYAEHFIWKGNSGRITAGGLGGAGFGAQNYDDNSTFLPRNLEIDSAGNILYLGVFNVVNTSRSVMIKFASDFSILWKKELKPAGNPSITSMALNSVGDAFYNTLPSPLTFAYAKLSNSTGAVLKGVKIGTNTNVAINKLYIDSADNLYALGKYSTTARSFTVVKLNSSDVVQWATNFQHSGDSTFTISVLEIVVADSGNVYVAGKAYNSNAPYLNYYYVIKLNSTGAVLWQKRISGTFSSTEYSKGIAGLDVDSEENIYLCLREGSRLIKLDANGVSIYQRFITQTNSLIFKINRFDKSMIFGYDNANTLIKLNALPLDGTKTSTYSNGFSYATATDKSIDVSTDWTVSSLTLTASAYTPDTTTDLASVSESYLGIWLDSATRI